MWYSSDPTYYQLVEKNESSFFLARVMLEGTFRYVSSKIDPLAKSEFKYTILYTGILMGEIMRHFLTWM